MATGNILIFVAILAVAVIIFIFLVRSRKKKGPLVSGEDIFDNNSTHSGTF